MNFAHFLNCIVNDLRSSLPVSLGFEAPLFVPVAQDFQQLNRARNQEPSAWSFGAGAYVTAVAVPLMSYVLRHIHEKLNPAPRVTLDPAEWMPRGASGPQLHLWEAFVWGPGHARAVNGAGLEPHVQDAATAALAFVHWEGMETRPDSDITAANPFSTVGAAVLWSGLSTDIGLLHKDVLVLRPQQVLGAGVLPYEPV